MKEIQIHLQIVIHHLIYLHHQIQILINNRMRDGVNGNGLDIILIKKEDALIMIALMLYMEILFRYLNN